MSTNYGTNDWKLCNYQFADGRCCPNPVAPNYKAKGFCRSHGDLEKFRNRPAQEINEFLFLDPFEHNPLTESEVQGALAVVFRSLAIGKISTRRAATLGYLGQLMMQKTSIRENRETLSMSTVITGILKNCYAPESAPLTRATTPVESSSPDPSITDYTPDYPDDSTPPSALPSQLHESLPAPPAEPAQPVPLPAKPTFTRISRNARNSSRRRA